MGAPSTAHDPAAASAAALALPPELAEPYVDLDFARLYIAPPAAAAHELRDELAEQRAGRLRPVPLVAGASALAVLVPLRAAPAPTLTVWIPVPVAPDVETRERVEADDDLDAMPRWQQPPPRAPLPPGPPGNVSHPATDERLTLAAMGLPPLADDDPFED